MRLAAALLIATLSALPAAAQQQETRSFKDWGASCEADGYCAASQVFGGAVPDYRLSIGRHPEQSYWEVSLHAFTTQPDEWKDFVISVDGADETFSLFDQVGAYGDDRSFYFLGDGAQRVMDRMTPGSAVGIAFTDTTGAPRNVTFSLSGLTAALLWIDEQQKRLGSERVAGVPPYGLVPVYSGSATPDIPLALLDRHRADPDCPPLEELANGRDFVVARLDDANTLYLLPCQTGAYNFAQKVYVQTYDEFYPQYFADYSGDIGWTGTPYVWNAEYDDATKTIRTFAKARGIGDCGSMATYTWAGYQFRLEEMRERDCTDDVDPEGEMPEFPVVYTAPPLPASE